MCLQELHSTRAPLKKDHRRGRGDPLRRLALVADDRIAFRFGQPRTAVPTQHLAHRRSGTTHDHPDHLRPCRGALPNGHDLRLDVGGNPAPADASASTAALSAPASHPRQTARAAGRRSSGASPSRPRPARASSQARAPLDDLAARLPGQPLPSRPTVTVDQLHSGPPRDAVGGDTPRLSGGSDSTISRRAGV
jgi:hypothetical protein